MIKQIKSKLLSGERRKMISQSTKDYFLMDNTIFPVNTMTQRAKLESLKDFIELQEDKKYTHTPIRKPLPPKINPHQELSKLTLDQKKKLSQELEKNLNITKTNPYIIALEKEMKTISTKIIEQNEVNRQMLKRLQKGGQMMQIQCENKIQFFDKLLLRKQGFIESIKRLFTNIFTKEYKNDKGEITLTELLYSHNSLSMICSSDKLRSQDQLTSQKDLLIRQITQKLMLMDINQVQDLSIQKNKLDLSSQETFPKFQLNIPMIMTKDRREELQKEEIAMQKKIAQCQIQQRIATQLSLITRSKVMSEEMVDTSLAYVGNYLTKLSQYILQNYFEEIIELINMPYGKPAIERLSQLHGNNVGQDILPFILSEKLFEEFDQRLNTNQHEKLHHKALFDSLNHALNIYRPYYNFKGQIYPWLVTEKGMTFYSISEGNIEEVLDKCKMSIMEKAASLCGVLSQNIINQKTQSIYEQKRKDRIQKMVQQEIVQSNWLQSQDVQAKMMLQFGRRVIDWLIDQVVIQTKKVLQN